MADPSRPAGAADGPGPGPAPSQAELRSASSGGHRTDAVPWPAVRLPDPSELLQTEAEEASSRRCGFCRETLRPEPDGRPADKGSCHVCGTPFCFSPTLRRGAVIDARYEIEGRLGEGGFGWVYLARARHLDGIHVVLKGLRDPADARAADAWTRERLALIYLDHPNLVRILDFVRHPHPGSGEPSEFIVMEHVSGPTLAQLAGRSGATGHPPLSIELAIDYGRDILDALAYLHDRGLLYGDMKPANAIRTADRIKVVDLGAVRSIGDRTSPHTFTRAFAPPREEIDRRGWQIDSDLFTVARTLEALYQTSTDFREEGSARSPVQLALTGFRRVVARATHPDEPARRFTSAGAMSEQLRGVLLDVLALREGPPGDPGSAVTRVPVRPSTLFEDIADPLDGGLGRVPRLARWTAGPSTAPLAVEPPAPAEVATGLPTPRLRADDPAAATLSAMGTPDPEVLLRQIEELGAGSVEVQLAACRAHLRLGRPGPAAERLDAVADPADWRVDWHRALVALTGGDTATAGRHLLAVHAAVPGEPVPKLALAFCAEHHGRAAVTVPPTGPGEAPPPDHADTVDALDRGWNRPDDGDPVPWPDLAASLYELVHRRDRTRAAPAFGLARLCLYRGDRAGAVRVLDEVPVTATHGRAAALAAVRALSEPLAGATGPRPGEGCLASAGDVVEAGRRLAGLRVDGGAPEGPERTRLAAMVQEAALGHLLAGGSRDLPPGAPTTARAVRARLERTFHELAGQARDAAGHGRLIDRANAVRPRTWW